ncbi:MAG: hypothetical protein ACP5MB_01010 [bacterium]
MLLKPEEPTNINVMDWFNPKNAIGKFAHSFGVPMQSMGRAIHLRYKDFLL